MCILSALMDHNAVAAYTHGLKTSKHIQSSASADGLSLFSLDFECSGVPIPAKGRY
jgi:hypothetical protein